VDASRLQFHAAGVVQPQLVVRRDLSDGRLYLCRQLPVFGDPRQRSLRIVKVANAGRQ
jgi:hypothetical protein